MIYYTPFYILQTFPTTSWHNLTKNMYTFFIAHKKPKLWEMKRFIISLCDILINTFFRGNWFQVVNTHQGKDNKRTFFLACTSIIYSRVSNTKFYFLESQILYDATLRSLNDAGECCFLLFPYLILVRAKRFFVRHGIVNTITLIWKKS